MRIGSPDSCQYTALVFGQDLCFVSEKMAHNRTGFGVSTKGSSSIGLIVTLFSLTLLISLLSLTQQVFAFLLLYLWILCPIMLPSLMIIFFC